MFAPHWGSLVGSLGGSPGLLVARVPGEAVVVALRTSTRMTARSVPRKRARKGGAALAKWSPCSELTTGSGVTMRLSGVTMRLIGGELRVGVPSSAPSGG